MKPANPPTSWPTNRLLSIRPYLEEIAVCIDFAGEGGVGGVEALKQDRGGAVTVVRRVGIDLLIDGREGGGRGRTESAHTGTAHTGTAHQSQHIRSQRKVTTQGHSTRSLRTASGC